MGVMSGAAAVWRWRGVILTTLFAAAALKVVSDMEAAVVGLVGGGGADSGGDGESAARIDADVDVDVLQRDDAVEAAAAAAAGDFGLLDELREQATPLAMMTVVVLLTGQCVWWYLSAKRTPPQQTQQQQQQQQQDIPATPATAAASTPGEANLLQTHTSIKSLRTTVASQPESTIAAGLRTCRSDQPSQAGALNQPVGGLAAGVDDSALAMLLATCKDTVGTVSDLGRTWGALTAVSCETAAAEGGDADDSAATVMMATCAEIHSVGAGTRVYPGATPGPPPVPPLPLDAAALTAGSSAGGKHSTASVSASPEREGSVPSAALGVDVDHHHHPLPTPAAVGGSVVQVYPPPPPPSSTSPASSCAGDGYRGYPEGGGHGAAASVSPPRLDGAGPSPPGSVQRVRVGDVMLNITVTSAIPGSPVREVRQQALPPQQPQLPYPRPARIGLRTPRLDDAPRAPVAAMMPPASYSPPQPAAPANHSLLSSPAREFSADAIIDSIMAAGGLALTTPQQPASPFAGRAPPAQDPLSSTHIIRTLADKELAGYASRVEALRST